jgi:DNA-binding NarL/FixJ family response regulator
VGKAKGTAVCFCVLHPLVLQELQRLVDEHPFRLMTCRLDATAIATQAPLRIPRASVYVVDSPARRQDAEFLVSTILTRFPQARVRVVAERLDEATSFAFLRAGAKGVLRYSEVSQHLVAALETLAAGGFWAHRSLLSRFLDEMLQSSRRRTLGATDAALSRREREVLALLLENFSNKEIASRLHISSRTAKFHVSNVLAKYRVKRRADLLLMRLA